MKYLLGRGDAVPRVFVYDCGALRVSSRHKHVKYGQNDVVSGTPLSDSKFVDNTTTGAG